MVPGAETAQIERLTALATRVSLNLEAPCGDTLARHRARQEPRHDIRDARASARLSVHERGARSARAAARPAASGRRGGDDDAVRRRRHAGHRPHHRRHGLRALCRRRGPSRAFQRVPSHSRHADRDVRAAPALREHRLYQADYLLRDYGFAPDEVVYDADGNLPLANDPKTAWALAHPEHFPVEVTTASRERCCACRASDRPTRASHRGGAARAHICAGSRTCAPGRRHHARRRFLTLGGRRLQSVRWSEQLGFWRPRKRRARTTFSTT